MVSRQLDPQVLAASGALLRTQLQLSATIEAEAVAGTGLDPTILDLLVRLDQADERRERASRLCQQLNLSAAHMSRTIDRAETAGLVQRQPDPTDRRAQLIVLTTAGDAALADFAPRLHTVLQRVIHDRLDPAEIETLIALLERIEQACLARTSTTPDDDVQKETTHA
jgi:DNA-binding MarR family transcriptional regulator